MCGTEFRLQSQQAVHLYRLAGFSRQMWACLAHGRISSILALSPTKHAGASPAVAPINRPSQNTQMPSRGQSQPHCQLPPPSRNPAGAFRGAGPRRQLRPGRPSRRGPGGREDDWGGARPAAQPGFLLTSAAPLLAERATSSRLTEEVRGK